MNNRSTLFLAMLPLLGTASLSYADDSLAPVVVTATRTAQSADEALASVTVINRDEIERSQAQSLPDLLNGLAGIDITSNGGSGKTTSIFMRGTNAGHTLILIDGVQIGSATFGSASPQYLPLAEIERIEIVRGPQSALYGSDAIGGIIQIFTRQGGDKTRFNASAGAGQMNTRQVDAGVSSNIGKLSYHVQASRFSSDYIDVQGAPSDLDGYNNNAGSFNAKYRLSDTAGIEANVLRASGVNQYDNIYDPTASLESRFIQQIAGAKVYLAPTSQWQLSLRSGESRDYSTEYRDGFEGDHFNTRRVSHTLQNDFTLSSSDLLSVGLDHQTDYVASTVNYVESSRANTGLFVQNQWQGAGHSLTVGARRDDNEAFGLHTTGHLAWGYRFADNLRLMASYGTGFKAPSFNELYWPSGLYYSGNPNLKPEESQGGEIGISQSEGGSHWSVHYFNSLITNLIVYDASMAASNNVASARIQGIEIEGGIQSHDWRLNGTATFEDPRDADTGHYLPRRARQTVRFDLDRLAGRFTWGPSITLAGDRYDDKNNTTLLRGYTLANLHAAYQLMPDLSLRAKVDNLFDESYTNVAGYNMPGRVAFVSINYLTR